MSRRSRNRTQAEVSAQMSACFQMRRASRELTRAYDEALRPVGLLDTQFTLLMLVKNTGAISIKDLAARIGADDSTIGRNLRVLERDGHVVIEAGADARLRMVRLTRKGRAIVDRAWPLWQQVQEQFVDAIGAERIARLFADLEAAVLVFKKD